MRKDPAAHLTDFGRQRLKIKAATVLQRLSQSFGRIVRSGRLYGFTECEAHPLLHVLPQLNAVSIPDGVDDVGILIANSGEVEQGMILREGETTALWVQYQLVSAAI